MFIIEFFRDTLSGIYYFIYVAIDLFLIFFLLLKVSFLKKKENKQPNVDVEAPDTEIAVPVQEEPVEEKSDIPSIFMQDKAVNEKYANKINRNNANNTNNINQNTNNQ